MGYVEPKLEDVIAAAGPDKPAAVARVVRDSAAIIASEMRRGALWGRPNDEDCAQECQLAVLLAIRRFDASRGVPFGAYVRTWIRAAIREHRVRHVSIVKISSSRSARAALRRVFGHDVNDDLARAAARACHGVVCLDALDMDVLPPVAPVAEEVTYANELRAAVARALGGLPRRSASVLRARARGEVLATIGARMGLTRERVRQIEKGALDQVRGTIHR